MQCRPQRQPPRPHRPRRQGASCALPALLGWERPGSPAADKAWTGTAEATTPNRGLCLLRVVAELAADAQHALEHRQPSGRGEEVDRPLQAAPRGEDETGRDHDHTLGPTAEADVALEPEQLGLGARVRDEERA